MSGLLANEVARVQWTPAPVSSDAFSFHSRLPGYRVTELRSLERTARELGLQGLWAKNESSRLGLESFKILGASWAVHRLLQAELGEAVANTGDLSELKGRLQGRELGLVAATDGNHGRAVAHMAALLGLDARIFVPAGTAAARIAAIEQEGADVEVVDGSYDDAVALAARQASDRTLVVADIAWPGYERVPRWIVEGYSTILLEADRQGAAEPDLVLVQMGCGSLASAVIRHYRQPGRSHRPIVIGVEPEGAACVTEAVTRGAVVQLPGRQESIMAGLNCGTASSLALDDLLHGLDYTLTIADERARQAMRALAAEGLACGETGAAGLAGLLELASTSGLPVGEDGAGAATALIFLTEGNTDPERYREIVASGAA